MARRLQTEVLIQIVVVEPGDRGLQNVRRRNDTPWVAPAVGLPVIVKSRLGLRTGKTELAALAACHAAGSLRRMRRRAATSSSSTHSTPPSPATSASTRSRTANCAAPAQSSPTWWRRANGFRAETWYFVAHRSRTWSLSGRRPHKKARTTGSSWDCAASGIESEIGVTSVSSRQASSYVSSSRPRSPSVITPARRLDIRTTRNLSAGSVIGRAVQTAQQLVEVVRARFPSLELGVQHESECVESPQDEPDLRRWFPGLQTRQPAAAHIGGCSEFGLGHIEVLSAITDKEPEIPSARDPHRLLLCTFVRRLPSEHVRADSNLCARTCAPRKMSTNGRRDRRKIRARRGVRSS